MRIHPNKWQVSTLECATVQVTVSRRPTSQTCHEWPAAGACVGCNVETQVRQLLALLAASCTRRVLCGVDLSGGVLPVTSVDLTVPCTVALKRNERLDAGSRPKLASRAGVGLHDAVHAQARTVALKHSEHTVM